MASIFKTITENLNSKDGAFYDKVSQEVEKDEKQLEYFLKNQISVTTSVIKNLNHTIRKSRIDQETFNENLHTIQNITNN